MKIEANIFKSVFSIRDKEVRVQGRRPRYIEEKHRGFAVAISPNHLLTAFHCVRPYSDPCLFVQPEQDIRIENGFHVVDGDEAIDLAVVEVPEKLDFYRPVVTLQDKPHFWDRLILVNHFNDIQQSQPVSRCILTTQDLHYRPNYHVSSYKMPVRAIGGYSGSPIFTEDGSVASVAVKVNNNRQNRAEAVSDFVKSLGFPPLNIPFEAIDPKHVTRFMAQCRM